MGNYDWSCFKVRIDIKAKPEKLFWCWATREGMESWFLRVSEYKKAGTVLANDALIEKGDTYRWQWHGWPDELVEEGKILDCNGKDSMAFSFGMAGNCTVRIYTEKDEQIVEIRQENIPADDEGKSNWHVGCKTGWTFYLVNLKSVLEGGVDLRNKNENLKQVINA